MADTEAAVTGQDTTNTGEGTTEPEGQAAERPPILKDEATQKEEGKPEEGDKEPEGEKKDEKAEGAPEAYEDFKVPDGVVLDESLSGEFVEVAKDLNLSQDAAQKLVDIAVRNAEKIVVQQQEAWNAARDKWVEDLKADPEYGGHKFEETATRANRAMNKYFSPDFVKYVVSSGWGDYHELVKGLARIDKAVGEDTLVEGAPSSGTKKSAADLMYT